MDADELEIWKVLEREMSPWEHFGLVWTWATKQEW